MNTINQSYGRSTQSRREGTKQIVKKSSSGFRNIKNSNNNFSVDVREYFNDGIKPTENYNIPIQQNHGQKNRGLSSDQMQADRPENLNLLFYNFNRSGKEQNSMKRSSRIMEEQAEFEDDEGEFIALWGLVDSSKW